MKVFPVTSSQRGLWIEWCLNPENPAYNNTFRFSLKGSLNYSALKKALILLTARHDALRTCFKKIEDIPCQVIYPYVAANLSYHDLSNLAGKERNDALEKLLIQLFHSPFDIQNVPLFRYSLIKLKEDLHEFRIVWHHIINDGTAITVLCRELSEIYNKYLDNEEVMLPQIHYNVEDFLKKEQTDQLSLNNNLMYWRQQLNGACYLLNLFHKRSSKLNSISSSHRRYFKLSIEETTSISELVNKTNSTLFIVLMSAFSVLLHRYTAQNDFVLGYFVNTRDKSGIEYVNSCINALPMRIKLEDNLSIFDVIKIISETRKQDKLHQKTHLEELMKEIRKDSTINSLFNVIVSQTTMSSFMLNLKNIQSTLKVSTFNYAKYDLILLFDKVDTIALECEYNIDKFHAWFIDQLLESFVLLLHEIILYPSKPIHQLNLVPKDRLKKIFQWNKTTTVYPKEKIINQLFEEQVARTPNATAVIFDSKQLTYEELNAKSNQLAHYLQEIGVKQETFVAISIERSLELIIGLLGILKAGGAYVPLDPNYPSDRLDYMLEDTQVFVLLTEKNLVPQFSHYSGRIICLDSDWKKLIEIKSTENLKVLISPQQAAYVIYTSGSTGKPKGVIVEHAGAVNRLLWMQSEYNLSEQDRVLQKTPFSFDVSVWEFFWPLIVGAQLVIAKAGIHQDPLSLKSAIVEYQISVLHFVPSMLMHFLTIKKQALPSLRLLFTSGEVLTYELMKDCIEKLPNVNLHNLYGPTEATIDVSYWKCKLDSKEEKVLIGKPIANVQLYVLDKNGRIVLPGVTGELYIGGIGVARGYLNRSDVTAERFLANPFVTDEEIKQGINTRLYRTGDLVRYLKDGNIEYLGRTDSQIKLRGFRIELGEIESVIRTHASIKDVVVIMRKDLSEEPCIVSYLVFANNDNVQIIEEVREILSKQLPEYMLPNYYVKLEELPLTANGKLDRKALPIPAKNTRSAQEIYTPPRNDVEKLLVKLWSELLKIEESIIGIHDNFFKLGGNSLLATRLHSRLCSELNLDLTLRTLFNYPTIIALSNKIEEERREVKKAIKMIELQPRPQYIPLSFAQERLWFIDKLLPNSVIYNVPIAFKLKGKLDKIKLEQVFKTLMERHESLRTEFISQAGLPKQIIKKIDECPLPMQKINLNRLPINQRETEAIKLCEKLLLKPFDLSKAPLFYVYLIELNEIESIMLINMHHIISDGWSLSVLAKEISQFYNHYVHKTHLSLKKPFLQYVDFALWHRNWLKGKELEKQLNYWCKKLKDVPEILGLPTDRKRPDTINNEGKTYIITLESQLCHKIRSLAEQNQATLFMILLSGLGVLLNRYTSQETIIIGSPIANRHYHGIGELIGCFINTLALRIDINENLNFVQVLKQVRRTTLDAYAHQDLPLEQLIENLQISRKLNYQPLFQVMMVLQNNEKISLELEKIDVKPLILEFPGAKFDLSLYATEELDGTLSIGFEYATQLFVEETIKRLSNHFVEMFKEIVKCPEKNVTELSFLTMTEKQQLITDWNYTDRVYPRDKTIHELFELQANKTPEDVALILEGQVLTYRELNEKSNQLANYLRTLGVKAEILVALCMDSSFELIISILGILKAGGIYVPIDAKYPQVRLKHILQDLGSSFLLTTNKLLNILGSLQTFVPDIKILPWENVAEAIINYDTKNLSHITQGGNIAYLIYTSGSTGIPKGVSGTHRGTINRLFWSWETFPFEKKEICCQKTSLSFVDHIAELFSPLLQGVPLVLVSKHLINEFNLPQFLEWIYINQITRIVLVPSLLKVILEQELSELKKMQTLKYVFCSGEALTDDLVSYFAERFPLAQLINIYGSSEVSADASYYRISNENNTLKLYFEKGLQKLKDKFQVAKNDLITTPNIEINDLKEKFKTSQIPLLPQSYEEYFDKLKENIIPYTINIGSPYFIGHMTSVLPIFNYDLSKLMIALNQNVVKIETSKVLTFVEREAIAMLHHTFYNQPKYFYETHTSDPSSTLGIITSNGTIANITALCVARNQCFPATSTFRGISEEGLSAAIRYYGYQDVILLVSPLAHYSIEKAASLLGIGKKHIHHLPLTPQYTIDIDTLRENILNYRANNVCVVAIIGIAGATETGSIDPLVEMASIAQQFGIHFHVDAAFGGPLIFSDKYKYLLKGIECADTITICGHKQLYLSMGISVCLFQQPKSASAIYSIADYQATKESYDFGKSSLEGSRPAYSLLLHACLNLIGKKGYGALVEEGIENANYFKNYICENDEFELLLDPIINIVNYRYISKRFREKVKKNTLSLEDNKMINEVNQILQEEQFKKGKTFVSKTYIPSIKYQMEILTLRAIFSNPLIKKEDIKAVLDDQLEIATQLFECDHKSNLKLTVKLINSSKNIISIGKPIANTKIYILDKHLSLLPIGVVGELYISGDNLANGYYNQPSLTAERFIANPFVTDKELNLGMNSRLFKTGDLARFLSDGNIEYLGRIDNQIKIRGFRVELSEIESVIRGHLHVKETAVIAREDGFKDKQIVAYLVLKKGVIAGLVIKELINLIASQLPDFMLPSAYVILDKLPLNSSSKLDIKALPLPNESNRDLCEKYVGPKNEIEQNLVKIWADLLKIDDKAISVHDNFFKLGGHSLLATQLNSRINQLFKIKLDLRVLFDSPTIYLLAVAIQKLPSFCSDVYLTIPEDSKLDLIQINDKELI